QGRGGSHHSCPPPRAARPRPVGPSRLAPAPRDRFRSATLSANSILCQTAGAPVSVVGTFISEGLLTALLTIYFVSDTVRTRTEGRPHARTGRRGCRRSDRAGSRAEGRAEDARAHPRALRAAPGAPRRARHHPDGRAARPLEVGRLPDRLDAPAPRLPRSGERAQRLPPRP